MLAAGQRFRHVSVRRVVGPGDLDLSARCVVQCRGPSPSLRVRLQQHVNNAGGGGAHPRRRLVLPTLDAPQQLRHAGGLEGQAAG